MNKLTPRRFVECVRKGAVLTVMHDGIEHAGYLAFLGLLSLFPFLVFLVAIIGLIGQGSAGAAFISAVLKSMPVHIAGALTPRIEEIISGPPQTLLTGAIWTASSAVEGIRTILNRAYHVATPPAYLLRRSLSIAQLLLFTFIMVVGMLIVILLPLLLEHIEEWMGTRFILAHEEQLKNLLFYFAPGVLFSAVAFLYYLIPNIKQRFVSVAPGAFVVVLGWIGAARLLTLYLLNFDQVSLIYGSLGGIIAALVFFYICNIIFIFGAELNHQIVDALGLHLREKEQPKQ